MENQTPGAEEATDPNHDRSAKYFSTQGREGLLGQLHHLLQFGDGIPVLIGAPGSGKSVLLQQLAKTLTGVEFCCLYRVEPNSTLSENLAQVSDLLGIKAGDDFNVGAMLVALRHFGQALSSDQQQGVLLLDDAHNLDDSALAAFVSLSQIEESSSHGLSLLFSGRPGLVERLDDLRILEVPIYDFTVPAFSSDELLAFLHEPGVISPAMRNAGPVSPDSVRRLWASSLGNPGVALRLLENEASTYLQRDPVFPVPEWLKEWRVLSVWHFAALAVLIVILIGWAITGREPMTLPVDTQKPLKPPSFEPVDQSASSLLSESSASSLSLAPQTPKAVQVSSSQATAAGFSSYQPSSMASQTTATSASVANVLSSKKPLSNSSSSVTQSVKTVGSRSVNTTGSEKPDDQSSSLTQRDQGASGSDDEVFLLAQDDDAYTLQVLAASKKSSLRGYIDRQPNKSQLYLYKGYRQGGAWYVVVSGVFPSRAAALQGIKALPEAQRKAGPWPRKIGKIKEEIQKSTQ